MSVNIKLNTQGEIWEEIDKKYEKPVSGIPAADLANGVVPVLTDLIDDTAGNGDTNVTWSADKLHDEIDAIVTVSDAQPQQSGNKLWIEEDAEEEYSIPTSAEMTAGLAAKVNKPSSEGTSGQVLRTNGNGSTYWDDDANATDIANAVTDWLDTNVPTGTTVVVDSSLTVSGAAADSKKTGDEIGDLKNDLNIITASWTVGQSYNTPSSVTTIQPNATTTTAGYACTYMACSQGDVFYLTGKGGSGSKLWVWTKNDGTIISRADSNAVETHLKLVAPANAAYLLSSVDISQTYSLVKGDTVNGRIETAKTLATYRNLGDYSKYSIVAGKIDLLSALRPIPEREMSSAVFYKTSVFDYETYATALDISTLFEPLRVRDESGNQIAEIYCKLDAAKYKTAIVAYGYKADGMNDRPYRAEDVVDGILTLDSTTYYLVLHQYSNLDLLIGTEAPSYAAEYHVGAGLEYTTFHSCIAALNGDDTSKTIHVYGGTYDVLSELGGADFLDGLTGAENWYDVCDIIPPNTHVIGHGNVIFDLTIPSGTSADIAVLLSPINIMGSATIENVTINCNGGRYCVHAEGEKMTAYDNAVWRLLNCKINKSGNLSGVANAIGVGINNGDLLEIRDCVITNDGNAGVLVHDQQTVSGSYPYSPRIFITNCAIDVAYYPVVMSSTHSGATSGAVLEMTVNNCFVNNKFMRKIGNGKADVFKVTYINTPHRTQNGDGIQNIIPDTEYNNFALT